MYERTCEPPRKLTTYSRKSLSAVNTFSDAAQNGTTAAGVQSHPRYDTPTTQNLRDVCHALQVKLDPDSIGAEQSHRLPLQELRAAALNGRGRAEADPRRSLATQDTIANDSQPSHKPLEKAPAARERRRRRPILVSELRRRLLCAARKTVDLPLRCRKQSKKSYQGRDGFSKLELHIRSGPSPIKLGKQHRSYRRTVQSLRFAPYGRLELSRGSPPEHRPGLTHRDAEERLALRSQIDHPAARQDQPTALSTAVQSDDRVSARYRGFQSKDDDPLIDGKNADRALASAVEAHAKRSPVSKLVSLLEQQFRPSTKGHDIRRISKCDGRVDADAAPRPADRVEIIDSADTDGSPVHSSLFSPLQLDASGTSVVQETDPRHFHGDHGLPHEVGSLLPVHPDAEYEEWITWDSRPTQARPGIQPGRGAGHGARVSALFGIIPKLGQVHAKGGTNSVSADDRDDGELVEDGDWGDEAEARMEEREAPQQGVEGVVASLPVGALDRSSERPDDIRYDASRVDGRQGSGGHSWSAAEDADDERSSCASSLWWFAR